MAGFEQTILRCPRVTLRWLDEADAPFQLALHADPQVMHFINEPWTQLDEAHAAIEQAQAGYRDGSALVFGIELRETGQLIGNVNLHRFFEMNRRCEVGYALLPEHQGRGYVAEALTALIDYAFDELDLIRIEADINPRNTASARVVERLGFRMEGYMPQRWIIRGERQDSVFYGLLKSYWDERTGRLGLLDAPIQPYPG